MSQKDQSRTDPVMAEIAAMDRGSAVAIVGHPIHAMLVHFPIALAVSVLGLDVIYWLLGDPFFARAATWAAGGAFLTGIAASLVGLVEVVAVPGIRNRGASWTHAAAAMSFLAACAANWGLRISDVYPVLPDGLIWSLLCTVFAGIAGWHGGKLIFDHGIALNVSQRD
ncbi:MAG: DUF2231 domain-containing protein [Paracoccus sp. (in: a-proteobacteria)]|nr:DUF2231 domain-containing protein [Paracoccus sp. (in: a-proteobacteria)]